MTEGVLKSDVKPMTADEMCSVIDRGIVEIDRLRKVNEEMLAALKFVDQFRASLLVKEHKLGSPTVQLMLDKISAAIRSAKGSL